MSQPRRSPNASAPKRHFGQASGNFTRWPTPSRNWFGWRRPTGGYSGSTAIGTIIQAYQPEMAMPMTGRRFSPLLASGCAPPLGAVPSSRSSTGDGTAPARKGRARSSLPEPGDSTARRNVEGLSVDWNSHRYQRAEAPRRAHPIHHRRAFTSQQESASGRHGGRQPDL